MKPISYKDIDSWCDVYIKANDIELFGKFTIARVDHKTIPEGLYAYDIRHGDNNDWTEMVSIENHVIVNHCGTFVTDRKLDLPRYGYQITEYEYDYTNRKENMGITYKVDITFGNGFELDAISNDLNRMRKHKMFPVDLYGQFGMNIKRAYRAEIGIGTDIEKLYTDAISWLDEVHHDERMLFLFDLAEAMKRILIKDIEKKEFNPHWILKSPNPFFELRIDVFAKDQDYTKYFIMANDIKKILPR